MSISKRGVRARRRNVAKLAVTGALAAMALAFGAAPAAALPANYKPNGCTWSPDRGWYPTYYDFKNVCNRHDYCYDEMWFGGGESGRARCDSLFLDEARGWCNSYYRAWWWSAERAKCNGVAWTYYGVVRQSGKWGYFNNPYKN